MDTVSLETTDDKFLISIDKTVVDKDFVMQLIERIRPKYPAQKVNFSNDIVAEGQRIKSEWWQKNRKRLVGGEE